MKGILFSLFMLACYAGSTQTRLQVVQDSVRVNNAELIIRNSSKDINGVLYNAGNGRTRFIEVGKSLQFTVGGAAQYPQPGDTSYSSSDFVGRNIKVWRNGLFQYRSNTQGIKVDSVTGKIIFKPALQNGDKIHVEALIGVNLIADMTESSGSFTTNLSKLYAGVTVNGQYFTLRWATNNKTLSDTPRVVGLGSSTLFGQGLSAPNRLGDKIQAWLNANTTAPYWNNLAMSGYSSLRLLPVASGGTPNYNIEAALAVNPDFIFISLPGNDAVESFTVDQSMANYRMLDQLAEARGIPVFFETTQPRVASETLQVQQRLKALADSIRAVWPNRFVEGFNDLVDVSAGTPAVLLSAYAQSDGIHLTPAGNQFIADRLFARWTGYFQPIVGVQSYLIQSSKDSVIWLDFDLVTDPNTVKKTYPITTTSPRYYRIQANYTNGGTSAFSRATTLPASAVMDTNWANAKRVLIELGGDGTSIPDGRAVPGGLDSLAKYWNNWTGIPGQGFRDSAERQALVTVTNENTAMSVLLLGNPYGTFGNTTQIRGINFNGFSTGVGDYPWQAMYDNMFVHYSQTALGGTTLRIKGLQKNATYRIKLTGARIDAASATPRMLEAKLSTQSTWTKSYNARYAAGEAPDYDRALVLDSITGLDSVDINLRAPVTNGVGHISLMDIKMLNYQPVLQTGVEYNDVSITLPATSVQLTGSVIIPGSIAYYTWGQVSGPSRAVITGGTTATPTISGLTNGDYEFKVIVNFTDGRQATDNMKLSVYPDNAGKKTMRVHFSAAAATHIPGWMNAFGAPNTMPIAVTDPVTGWRLASDSIGANYWKPLSGGNSSQDGFGEITGNNSGIVPDIALSNYWYNADKAHTTRFNIQITGLDSTKRYTIKIVGSRNDAAAAPRKGAYYLKDNPTPFVLNCWGNTSTQAIFTNVAPLNNKISLDVASPPDTGADGIFSYLNALIIQEEN